jgi:hypothetical protein
VCEKITIETIVVHAARSPIARPIARFFGPAQTRPGPLPVVLGLARPVNRARAWAVTPARGPARPGTELTGWPVGGPLPRPNRDHLPPSASSTPPPPSSPQSFPNTSAPSLHLRRLPPSTVHPLLQAPPLHLRGFDASAARGSPAPALPFGLPLHRTERPPPSLSSLPPSSLRLRASAGRGSAPSLWQSNRSSRQSSRSDRRTSGWRVRRR